MAMAMARTVSYRIAVELTYPSLLTLSSHVAEFAVQCIAKRPIRGLHASSGNKAGLGQAGIWILVEELGDECMGYHGLSWRV